MKIKWRVLVQVPKTAEFTPSVKQFFNRSFVNRKVFFAMFVIDRDYVHTIDKTSPDRTLDLIVAIAAFCNKPKNRFDIWISIDK